MNIAVIVILVLGLFADAKDTLQCPVSCSCTTDELRCSQLTAFPGLLESDVKRLIITMSHLPNIPAKAFKHMPNLEFIHFQQVMIGTIGACAFSEMKTSVNILIDLSEIGTIEGHAFNNLEAKPEEQIEVSISSSTIGRIESFAFDSIQGLSIFQLHSTAVELIQHYAFHRFNNIASVNIFDMNITAMETSAFEGFTSIAAMDVYHSTFDNIGCKTLDKARADLGRNFSFHSIDVNCDCALLWLYEAGHIDGMGLPLDDVICFKPGFLKHRHLSNLTREELCSKSVPQCNTPVFNRPEACTPRQTNSAGNDSFQITFAIILISGLL